MHTPIIKEDQYINGRDHELCWLDHLRMVQLAAFNHGFDITLKQASEVWGEYSAEECASFLDAALTNLESIWINIKPWFVDENPDWDFKKMDSEQEHAVIVEVYKKRSYIQVEVLEMRRKAVSQYKITEDVANGLTYHTYCQFIKAVNHLKMSETFYYYRSNQEIWFAMASSEFNTICEQDDTYAIAQYINDNRFKLEE